MEEVGEEIKQDIAEEAPQEKERVVYELGYHLLPTLDEEKVGGEVKSVQDIVTRLKGNIILEGSPRKIELAYTMAQNLGGSYKKFDTAYFGWMKFDMSPSDVASLGGELKGNQNILRFLLVKTVREDTAPQRKMFIRKEEPKAPPIRKLTQKEEKAPVSEEELDRQIEEMVSET